MGCTIYRCYSADGSGPLHQRRAVSRRWTRAGLVPTECIRFRVHSPVTDTRLAEKARKQGCQTCSDEGSTRGSTKMCNPNLKGQKQLLGRGPLTSSSTRFSLICSSHSAAPSFCLTIGVLCSLVFWCAFSLGALGYPQVLLVFREPIDKFSQVSPGPSSSGLTPLLVYVTGNLSFPSPKLNTYSLKALCPSSVPFSVSGFTGPPSSRVSDLPFSHHPLHVPHRQVGAVSVP